MCALRVQLRPAARDARNVPMRPTAASAAQARLPRAPRTTEHRTARVSLALIIVAICRTLVNRSACKYMQF